MQLPFTAGQFFEVFRQYNLAIWPAQIASYILGALILVLLPSERKTSPKYIVIILAAFWMFMGAIYHILFFSEINKAAYVFGIIFILESLLLLYAGVYRSRLSFIVKWNFSRFVGAAFILYAVLVYPLIGTLTGHGYPDAPIFGVAPCPTTIFTFGILLFADCSIPLYLIVIPLLWSFMGMAAALKLGVYEDIGLPVAGLAGTVFIFWNNRKFLSQSDSDISQR